MIYLIVILTGAFMGFLVLLSTGIPVVVLRHFQCLPLDRRLWWTLAAILAARFVQQIAIGENDYVVPTGGEQLAAYNAFRLGGFVCIGLLWFVGFVALFWLGSKGSLEPVSKLTWPVAAIVLLAGAILSVDHSDYQRKTMADQRAIVVAALKSGDVAKLEQLVADGEKLHQPLEELDNCEPFKYAVQQQDIAMIRFFMNRAEPDRPDMTVWGSNMIATGNREIIDMLFDAEGRTPEYLGRVLNTAVSVDSREAFDYALSLGGDPNHMYNYTALMIAAQRNMGDYADTLIAVGANVDTVHRSSWGKTNRTALSFAAEKGHLEMVRLLLDHNADPTIVDEDGKRPIDWAQSYDHEAIASLLANASHSQGEQP
ncbi:MAG: ankyrin repeat domain-containing protein [Fuerstiella sp.]